MWRSRRKYVRAVASGIGAGLVLMVVALTAPLQGIAQVAPARRPLPPGVRHIPDVVFRGQGADVIRLDLYLPAASTPRAALVFVGGGAGVKRSEPLGAHALQLAARGFVCAIVDYAPRAAGTRPPISAAVADVKLAVRWLRANASTYAIDRSRIGVVGAAEGGLVAALAGLPNWFGAGSNDNVAYPAEVAAVALFEPWLDLADTLPKQANEILDGLLTTPAPSLRPGGLETNVPYRVRISPTSYFGGNATRDVREHVPPFLFLHGTADALAPLGHSEKLASELRTHGYAAEIWRAGKAQHGFFRTPQWRDDTIDALARFFRRTLTQSTSLAGWMDSTPMWSPAGDRIVFHSTAGGEFAIWVVNADGSQLRRVAPGREAAWSPDGSRIAFESGEGRLATINVDGSGFRLVTNDTGEFVYAPSWSPDGSQLVVSSWVDNQLHLVRLADGGIRRLTDTTDGNGCSSWFPDGSRIAFHSYRDGQGELYVMRIADGTVTRLTESPTHEFCPRVSPDGRRIAFQRRMADVHERINLVVMEIDGGREYHVTTHPANDRWASWSPDGSRLAFSSTRGGNMDLYVVRADGSDLRRITNR